MFRHLKNVNVIRLSVDEHRRITSFASMLINIDKRVRKKKCIEAIKSSKSKNESDHMQMTSSNAETENKEAPKDTLVKLHYLGSFEPLARNSFCDDGPSCISGPYALS